MTKWFILIGVIALLCIAEWIREIVGFQITHYHIQSDKLNRLSRERSVVFLSDLHNNRYGKNNQKLLEAVKEQNPDMILIGGDMLIGKFGVATENAKLLIRELTKICPVYYAHGNHEQRIKINEDKYGDAFTEYVDELDGYGVRFLENESADVLVDDISICIYGLDIPEELYKARCKKILTLEEMKERIGMADFCKYNILLAHNPVHTQTHLEWGADLILSGHLHGGIVRIPGLGGVISPHGNLFPKYSKGIFEQNGQTVVVSSGLGTHTIKFRFLNPAELIVLHIG